MSTLMSEMSCLMLATSFFTGIPGFFGGGQPGLEAGRVFFAGDQGFSRCRGLLIGNIGLNEGVIEFFIDHCHEIGSIY